MTCKTFIFLKGLWSQSVITVANPSPPSQPPIRVPISQPIEVFKVCEQCPNVKYERERYFVTVDIEKGMQDGQVQALFGYKKTIKHLDEFSPLLPFI
ncbi:hypothetical protein RHMOL_Rhmol01G0343700 [Rhododendron molle]|uniref:Uncharacterized protein n=1 Tax=Rhododendron molle TaxID=49168 RepID=A0ACC0QAJ8_RHOML|nr:hypothetical protein RHMOL_Rhmol01G0343700 [Rhododendron molle]